MEGIQIAGFKKSGKTFLSRSLMDIWEQKEIFADYIKFSHHNFHEDTTDTGKFIHPKRNVIGVSQLQSLVVQGKNFGIVEILSRCTSSRILVEGGKSLSFLPRIVCLNSPYTKEEWEALNNGLVLGTFSLNSCEPIEKIPHFTPDTILELGAFIENKMFLLAGLNCKACGFSTCVEAGQTLLSGFQNKNICNALHSQNIDIKVNGASIPLNPFAALFMENTLKGMLSTLKGTTSGKTEITFYNSPYKE